MKIFKNLYDKYCPVKSITMNQKAKTKPWMTKSLINACKKKNVLYKIFIKKSTIEAETKYKLYKNKLTNILRNSKKYIIEPN